jgi:hypothetical protein
MHETSFDDLAGPVNLKTTFQPPPMQHKPIESIETSEPISGGPNRRIRAVKAKSSQRLRYEAEVRVLINKIGDLEDLRSKLGLSKRKICQLLMVDPSAWTRWTRKGESAPPHIYRSLQWYLALEEKFPALDVSFWLQNSARAEVQGLTQKVARIETEASNSAAQAAIRRLERTVKWLMLMNTALIVGISGLVFWQFFLR